MTATLPPVDLWADQPSEDTLSPAWRGVGGHTIRLTVERGGYAPTLRIVCHNPKGAECRIGCPNKCDGICYCDADPVDQGECLAKVWIEEEDPWGCYGGAADIEIASALPVLVRWDGDGWQWALAPQVTA